MSILVYIDHTGGAVKKASLEALNYASNIAQNLEEKEVIGLALGSVNAAALAGLGQYGATKVWHDASTHFDQFDSQPITKAIAKAVTSTEASIIVFSHNTTGKSLAPRLSARLKAGLVAGATTLPNTSGGAFTVRKSVFSSKAFADYAINTDVKIISLNPNSFPVVKSEGTAEVTTFDAGLAASDFRIKVEKVEALSDKVSLTEAELVVSAGRGLKGPENWGMVEEMADILNAATACSRPVADVGWRPHHEHVGQTGYAISPNLYIAIGISGAIQHLAGVGNSKTIVVINKDPEAPFFKAADYGIVGDAFEVVPKLNVALRKFKAAQI